MCFGSLKSLETVTQKLVVAQAGDADELKQTPVRAASVGVTAAVAAGVLTFTRFQTQAQPED